MDNKVDNKMDNKVDNDMDTSTTTTKPPSLHSKSSSTTLAPTLVDQPEPAYREPCYNYTKRVGPPNPDAQPKRKSWLGKMVAKLPSSAVQQSLDARQRLLLEEERTGIRRIRVEDNTGSATAASLSYRI